jgi:translation initiation factor 1
VVLRREKSGRAGKVVTVVDGFDLSLDETFLERLAREARQFCGCGGTLKGRILELQGDQVDRVRNFLTGRGFRVAGP